MLKIKLLYEKNLRGDAYDECTVTGIEVSEWFCCLLFKKDIPNYLYGDIMETFWEDFNAQITDEVYNDTRDNDTAIIYMLNPITNRYEQIYQYT